MDINIAPEAPSTIDELKPKMQLVGKVIKTSLAGAIVDIGLDKPGVVHISQLQKEPVKRVEDVLQVGQTVDVWVRRVFPKKGRIDLTMIKPLGLEWRELKNDMVVSGKVTRLEKFGVFVDIGAERPGLVHISELTHGYIRRPEDVVKEGDEVEVKILEINRQKKQIRLSMKAVEAKHEDVIQEALTRSEKKDSEKPKEAKDEKQAEASEGEKEVAIPTAMEMALREAMEKSKTNEVVEKGKPRNDKSSQDLENILSRTLKKAGRN